MNELPVGASATFPIITFRADQTDPLSDFGQMAHKLQAGYVALYEAMEHSHGAKSAALIAVLLEAYRATATGLGVEVVA